MSHRGNAAAVGAILRRMNEPNSQGLTKLDLIIWFAVDRNDLFRLAREADRADAELMLYAQQYKNRRVSFDGSNWIEYRGKPL